MQRWNFLEQSSSLEPKMGVRDGQGEIREWTFNVVVNIDLLPQEIVGITGDCASLGNWLPANAVLMKQSESSENWTTTVRIPRDKSIEYRFFICTVDPTNQNIHIRRWETHKKPRQVEELAEGNQSFDIFGDINGVEKIDRGWLTTETIIQFKFFNSPFMLKKRMKNHILYVKVTPMCLSIPSDIQNSALNLEDSLSNDTRENGADNKIYAIAEVASLKFGDSVIKSQSQFGIPCGPDDMIVFHVTVGDPDSVAYLVDLYTYSSKAVLDEPPYHLGYHYILPNALKRSEGMLEMPVTCATKHRPLGTMRLKYLVIKPLTTLKLAMRRSYTRYWNAKWTGLDVGHRGSGTSFKTKDTVIRENTITSLKNAASHGADMVEFDVQLSKDLVPVIYHDFHVYVSLKAKKTFNQQDLLELPMRDLTLSQLKNLKVYHLIEGRTGEKRNFDNEDLEEHQPFPQLAEVLDVIDPHVGFNIEIKWSQELTDGTMEAENAVDRNLYLDCILDVVLRNGGSRHIVFSCFDPDICTMLRFKQNIYPVMFLTLGKTDRYPRYLDPRCNSIEAAVSNARAMELLGIVAHTEDLLRDPTQISLATDQGLIIFCWGDDNNSKDTIQMLKKLGLHAIIYDKMDVLTSKEVKESIFLVHAKSNQSEYLQIQDLELERTQMDPPMLCKVNPNTVLELENQREKNVISTATSIESLLDREYFL